MQQIDVSIPRFSIVVPAYNAAATLPETLEAISAQQFRNWECVVVDDGSTDATAALARRYCAADPRFRLVSQQNTGAGGAYRAGIAAASSDLLVICAADDLLLPNHLSAMDRLIGEKPDFEIYSSNGEYMSQLTGRRSQVYTEEPWLSERSLTFEDLLEACFFGVGTVFRRQAYEDAGGHRYNVYADDYDLWLRMMAHGARHLYTPLVLSVHRVSGFQQSANKIRVLESEVEVYEHLLTAEELAQERQAAAKAAIERRRKLIADEIEKEQKRPPGRVLEKLLASRLVGRILWVIFAKRRRQGR